MRWQVEERCVRVVGAFLRTALRPHHWMLAAKLPVRKWLTLRRWLAFPMHIKNYQMAYRGSSERADSIRSSQQRVVSISSANPTIMPRAKIGKDLQLIISFCA
jgi:hypothetical protein